MRHSLLIAAASLLLATQFAPESAADDSRVIESPEQLGQPWAVGKALARNGSEILYREYHYADDEDFDMPTRVLYLRENGELFAEKTIDYRVSQTAPAFTFIDYRTQARISAEHHNGAGAGAGPGTVRVSVAEDGQSDVRSQDMTLSDQLIIDAGFDPFIREHWHTLTGGSRLTAPFLVPSRMDTVRVGVTSSDNRDCRAMDNTPLVERFDRESDIACFTVRPAGMLRVVGWLVDPIRLAYSADGSRLLMFDGTSNIPDDDGETQHVVLVYEYPESH